MAEEPQDAAEVRLNRLLALILETAVETLGYDAATITARHQGSLSTVAATDPRLVLLDEVQYQSGHGPCLTALDAHDPVAWTERDGDAAWQAFADAARQLAVSSSFSVHVPTDDAKGTAASLNLYSRSHRALADEQIRSAVAFAQQLAEAMLSVDAHRATAKLAEGLAAAMRTRAVIEQAKGMLMSERQITADQAFEVLTKMSKDSNVKLRDVAQRLVEARSTGAAEH